LRTFFGIFENKFTDFREAVSLENKFTDFREAVSLEKIFEIVQENILKFPKLISFLGPVAGHALGIWICGCSLFYKRELWASKSAGTHSTKSLKISGCKR
jgi:hypothetical protein